MRLQIRIGFERGGDGHPLHPGGRVRAGAQRVRSHDLDAGQARSHCRARGGERHVGGVRAMHDGLQVVSLRVVRSVPLLVDDSSSLAVTIVGSLTALTLLCSS